MIYSTASYELRMISYKSRIWNKSHELKYMIYRIESFMIWIHLTSLFGEAWFTERTVVQFSEGCSKEYDFNKNHDFDWYDLKISGFFSWVENTWLLGKVEWF